MKGAAHALMNNSPTSPFIAQRHKQSYIGQHFFQHLSKAEFLKCYQASISENENNFQQISHFQIRSSCVVSSELLPNLSIPHAAAIFAMLERKRWSAAAIPNRSFVTCVCCVSGMTRTLLPAIPSVRVACMNIPGKPFSNFCRFRCQ